MDAVLAERDAAITQARTDADACIRAAETARDQSRQTAADAKAAARQSEQGTARAQAAAQAAQAGTERGRADTERALGQACAEAAREREELRAEQQADAYRAELDRLRTGSPDPEPAGPPARAARRGTRTPAAQPRQATGQ